MPKMKKYTSIPQYLADFNAPTQDKLNQLMAVITEELPEAEQTFAYGIPTYRLDGKNIIHFAAYKTHIGFYPGSKPIVEFKDELEDFKTAKGTIQFPLDKPLPLDLIRQIVKSAKRLN